MGGVARAKQNFSFALSILLALTIGSGAANGMAYQSAETTSTGSTASSYPGQGVPATADELQSLVAPIALYPDALVAQILSAATFPDQVAIASYWVDQNKTLTGSALVTAVDKQTWDPSVKAITQFPSVLNNMAQNLSWTSQLGEDYHNQQADVMTAIQTLRAKAKAAGNLQSGPQITVVQKSPQIIVIQPTNPQIVCSAVQPDRYLWHSLCCSRLLHRGSGGRKRPFLWCRNGSWSHDEQRLGVQQLEL
jgi:hypothetical protein